jgi:hypothetical protein
MFDRSLSFGNFILNSFYVATYSFDLKRFRQSIYLILWNHLPHNEFLHLCFYGGIHLGRSTTLMGRYPNDVSYAYVVLNLSFYNELWELVLGPRKQLYEIQWPKYIITIQGNGNLMIIFYGFQNLAWEFNDLFCQIHGFFEIFEIYLCNNQSVHGCLYGWRDVIPHGTHKVDECEGWNKTQNFEYMVLH